VNALADVRSVPFSRWSPWFSQKALAVALTQAGISYAALGDAVGGRPRSEGFYRDGVADYDAMAAQPEFRAALTRLAADAGRSRICLMCAEREPLDCHRCLLVARHLAAGGLAVGHILYDGSIEPHAATEQRLLALDGEDDDLFAAGQQDRLAAAYRRRSRAVAFRQKVPAPAGAAESG
jgi:uncharacterized protein (DUF488 family)